MKLHHRLKNDFQLSILTLLCACAVFGIAPFAVWRFMQGDWFAGVLDSAILVGVVSAIGHAWYTGNTARAGIVLAAITCGGSVIVAILANDVGMFWMYPAILASFFLTTAGITLFFMSTSVLVLMLHGGAFSSTQQMLTFATTTVVVSACAFLFARRNEWQRSQLEHLANFDALTRVRNRRAMDMELSAAIGLHHSRKMPYGLAVTDLDHFKQVNDQFGHGVGDSVLLKFARILEMNCRSSDKVFRMGGEEFVILFAGADAAGLNSAVRQIQLAVRASLSSPAGPVTASFGTACLRDSDTQQAWIARADEALYRAKQNGRDRIESADTDAATQARTGAVNLARAPR